MYANLRVVDGDSNHFVIRRGFPLTDEHRHLIEIQGSSDPGLQMYAATGLASPAPSCGSTWSTTPTWPSPTGTAAS
jgi:hypothetical protein